MNDTFNPDCPNCQITISRIEKWIEHMGCSPKKFQRYNKLLDFVKRLGNDKFRNVSTSRIARCAQELLEEIGE